MSALAARLLSPAVHDGLAQDCVTLIESHIHDRSGWRGMVMRTGLGLLKSLRDDAVIRGVERLLPGFINALEPFYQQAQTENAGDFNAFLLAHSEQVSRQLVQVTDQIVTASSNRGVQAAYSPLRRFADEELQRALPNIAQVLEKHLHRAPR